MTQSIRRTAEQWQILVEQWKRSGQSATQFCKVQQIGYASFCHWRKRLADVKPTPDAEAPSFIDLNALEKRSDPAWHIVISLGNSIELRLSQQ